MSTRQTITRIQVVSHLCSDLANGLSRIVPDWAVSVCQELSELGAQTFTSLVPRGTRYHPATERIVGIENISYLASKVDSSKFSSEGIAQLCRVLAFWAGPSALPFLTKTVCYSNPTEALAGIYALQMIGGPQAFEFLEQLSGQEELDMEVQEAAELAISELVHGGTDYWFGPSRVEALENATAEDVAIRDSLTDPYEWAVAEEFLGTYLKYVIEKESPMAFRNMGIDQQEVGLKVKQWIDGGERNESVLLEAIRELGFVATPKTVVVMGPLTELFRSADVDMKLRLKQANDWWMVELKEGSESAKFLPRLSMHQWLNLDHPPTETDIVDHLYTTFDRITDLATRFANQLPALATGFVCLQHRLANALPARKGLTLDTLLKTHFKNSFARKQSLPREERRGTNKILIYVGNLSFSCSEQDLMDLFGKYGQVNRVQIILDRETNRSRGFGFVEMADEAQGYEAIRSLNGFKYQGRPLTVNEARPRQDSKRLN